MQRLGKIALALAAFLAGMVALTYTSLGPHGGFSNVHELIEELPIWLLACGSFYFGFKLIRETVRREKR